MSNQINAGLLKLEIPIEFGVARWVKVEEAQVIGRNQDTDPPRLPLETLLSLSTLPPVLLQISLPPSYPLVTPPKITSLRATHLWLSKPLELQTTLINQWQPGEGVIYNWIEYIRTGEFLSDLDMLSHEDNTTIQWVTLLLRSISELLTAFRIWHPAPLVLVPLLQAHEMSLKSQEFSNTSYLCSICLTHLKGSKCLLLSCGHIFCRSCLADFWGLCIAEGDVGRVGCADPECVKIGREAQEEEVARVVSEEDLQRWRWLWEKRNLERGQSITLSAALTIKN